MKQLVKKYTDQFGEIEIECAGYGTPECADQEEDGGCAYCREFYEIRKKLYQYEQAEEEGRLLFLPKKNI